MALSIFGAAAAAEQAELGFALDAQEVHFPLYIPAKVASFYGAAFVLAARLNEAEISEWSYSECIVTDIKEWMHAHIAVRSAVESIVCDAKCKHLPGHVPTHCLLPRADSKAPKKITGCVLHGS